MRGNRLLSPILGALALLAPASAGFAFSPHAEVTIAQRAAEYAPRDLARQIDKHREALREGVLVSIENPQTGRALDEVLFEEIDNAIEAIEKHRPFAEIVQRLGQVTHYVIVANDPLAVANGDPNEPRYRRDWPRYVESAMPRFNPTFYGDGRRIESRRDLEAWWRRTLQRSRASYPMVAAEYDRIHFGRGAELFDDRSTAFGVSALAYSHAISDTIGVLRYIWLRAGGGDRREFLKLTSPASP